MQNAKQKFKILSIITAVSFIYLAISPFVMSLFNCIISLIQGAMFRYVIISFFNNFFQNILCFVASVIAVICVFTKFDKIGSAVSSLLFWFSGIIALISTIVNSIRHDYIGSTKVILSSISNLAIYFIIFVVFALFAVFHLMKKPAPDFFKYLIFIPVALLLIVFVIGFFSNLIEIIKALFMGYPSLYLINRVVNHLFGLLGNLMRLLGFSALLFKVSRFKLKKKTA